MISLDGKSSGPTRTHHPLPLRMYTSNPPKALREAHKGTTSPSVAQRHMIFKPFKVKANSITADPSAL